MSESAAPNPSLLDRLARSLEHLRVVRLDDSGSVLEANAAFERDLDATSGALAGASVSDLMPEDDANDLEAWLRDGLPDEPVVLNFSRGSAVPVSLRCVFERRDDTIALIGEPMSGVEARASERMLRLNNELAVLSRENARKKRELERALDELETSYWHLRKIQEILPVCMECGKIKTGSTSWHSLVEYLKQNEIFVSHGYCPSCAEAFAREHGLEETP